MEIRCDVAVVGAGPAGSIAARALALAGLDVVLIDRARFPRDKACGDALLPDAVAALEEAGLAEAVRCIALAVPGAVFRSPRGDLLRIRGDFLTVRREILDALLVDASVAAGARLISGCRITGPLGEKETITGAIGALDPGGTAASAGSGSAGITVRSDVTVLACGSNPRLLDAFGVLARRSHSAVALRAYVASDPFPSLTLDGGPAIFISYDRSLLPGYGWSFPLPGGLWNVGCGAFGSGPEGGLGRWIRGAPPAGPIDLRVMLERFLGADRTPRAPRRGLRGATLRTGFTGALPSRGRVVVIGEALGLTLPLTGDGIGKAMQSGLIAARTIGPALASGRSAAPDLRAYGVELEARTRATYESFERGQRWMRVPAIPNLLVRKAARCLALREILEGIVAERVDPRVLFSPRGLLRTLLARPDSTPDPSDLFTPESGS
jgi:flavin-dependent dehydrogenase